MKKTKALGKMHLSLFPVLFLEEIFLHFFPHSIYPYFFPAYKQVPSLAAFICRGASCACFPFISPSSPLPLLPLSTRNTFLDRSGR